MASITTRSGKGSPLTNAEVDNNFTNINTELGQKESASNKGVANGYASLDGSGKVPSAQLPSYVDDVVEGANLAALPATGETGKIYVTLDTNKTYRWSGSAYVEISASPGSTDAVTEGSTNLYFTNARARGALSGTAPISYNSTSGAISHAVSGVTAGSYGSSTSVPVITVDATGHVTGVSTSSISGSLTFTGDVTGSGSTGSSTALTLANSGVAAGTYTKVTVDAKGRVTTGASLASGDVTTALGYTPLSNATSYLPLAGGTLTGSVEVTSGQNIRFGHANQSDGNDGKIGAALFGSGLNIVGTQTVANGGRIIRLWGSVQTDAGQTYIHTGNIGSYAPTLSGTGASGTWGISISGNSATTSQRSFSGDISSGGQGRFTGWYSGGAATGQAAEIGMSSGQGYIFVYNRDTGTYGTLNVAASAANMQFSGSTINVTAGSLQHGGNQVLHAGNYTSYSPSLGGSGASGTWGISISGNAATASNIETTQPSLGYSISGQTITYVGQGGPQVRSQGNGAAMMSFHRPGLFAANLGLDTDNQLAWGGWSYGTALGNMKVGSLGVGAAASGTAGRMNATGWTTTGRNYSNEWIEFPNYYGLYSPLNSATLYPNNNVYGSWRVGGTKNGWYGIDFESGVVQMMNRNSMGWYDNSYGWTVYWSGGTLYNYKNANGGGTQAVVLDSSNYTSYVSGGTPTLSVTSSTSFTAAANTHYVIVGGATTVTLPTSPSAGTIVWITVANGRTDTVIARNGQNINSLAENMTVDSAFAGIQLRYADATRGWVFT